MPSQVSPSTSSNAPRSAGMTWYHLQEQSIGDYCRLYRKLPKGHPDLGVGVGRQESSQYIEEGDFLCVETAQANHSA